MTGALLSLSPDNCSICQNLAELRVQLSDRCNAYSPEESALDQPDQNEHGAKGRAAEKEERMVARPQRW